jgi:hypothetical protein
MTIYRCFLRPVPVLVAFLGATRIFAASDGVLPDADAASLAFEYSYSSKAAVDQGAKVGDVAVHQFGARGGGMRNGANDLKWFGSAFWTRYDIDVTGDALLPDHLQSVGLDLGASTPLGSGWSFTGVLRPAFSGDSLTFSSATFNASAHAMFGYDTTAALHLMFGLTWRERTEYRVLPILGLRYSPSPDWIITAGFPRTRITYKLSPTVSLQGGVQYRGGGYYVSTAPGPGLNDTYLEFHEFRLGVGAALHLAENFLLELDGGAVLRRKFDYYDRSYALKGKRAGFLAVDARFRF